MANAPLEDVVPAGELRERVDIVAMNGPLNEDREPTPQVIGSRVYARVKPMSGQSRYMAEQFASRMSHVISIRYRRDMEKGFKVLYDGRQFNVEYPLDPTSRKVWLHLLCMEEMPSDRTGDCEPAGD